MKCAVCKLKFIGTSRVLPVYGFMADTGRESPLITSNPKAFVHLGCVRNDKV